MIRIIVSSTFVDLQDERAAVRAAIDDVIAQGWDLEPVVMEDLGAVPTTAQAVSEQMVEGSELMILLLGGRYGTVPPDALLAITHREYEVGRREKLPCLAYVAERDELDPRVRQFQERVSADVTPKRFSGAADLASSVRRDLEEWLLTYVSGEQAGLQRLDAPAAAPPVRFVDRKTELARLDEALQSARVGLWGPPGYGKTALVQRYLETHRARLPEPLWLRVDELFGRAPDGRPRIGSQRWVKEALLGRLQELLADRPRALLVFDNVQAAPRHVHWLAARLPPVPAIFISWDASALPDCDRVRLSPLPPDPSAELIGAACEPDQLQHDADAAELAPFSAVVEGKVGVLWPGWLDL